MRSPWIRSGFIDAYDVKSSAREESVTAHFPADDQYYSFKTTGERLVDQSDSNIKGQWAVILRCMSRVRGKIMTMRISSRRSLK